MTVFGYIFLDIKKKDRIPIARQQHLIERYAEQQGVQVVDFFVEENVSPLRPLEQRDQGRILLQNSCNGDWIIASHASAVFSRAKEGLRLVKKLQALGISLHLADLDGDIVFPAKRKLVISTGIHDVVTRLLTSLARHERSGHSTAIRHAKQIGKKQGRYLGGPVGFGWQIDEEGFIRENPKEQKIIQEIKKLRQERWSYRDISKILKERHSVSLSYEGIRKLLLNNEEKQKAVRRHNMARQDRLDPRLELHPSENDKNGP